MALAIWLAAPPVQGDDIKMSQSWPLAAASEAHFWVISEERVEGELVLVIMHRHVSDPPGVLRRTMTIPFKSVATSNRNVQLTRRIAASGYRLLLIADDHRIWSVTVSPNRLPNGPRWQFDRTVMPAIPGISETKTQGARLDRIQITTTSTADWLLLEGRLATSIFQPKTESTHDRRAEAFWTVVMDMPAPSSSLVKETSEASEDEALDDASGETPGDLTEPETLTPAEPVFEEGLFLFQRQGAMWQRVALPDPIDANKRRFLPSTSNHELVIIQLSDISTQDLSEQTDGALPGLGRVEVWRFEGSTWRMSSTGLDMPSHVITDTVMISNQAVLSQTMAENARQLYLLRQTQGATQRLKLHDLGVLRMDHPKFPIENTSLVGYEQAVTLVLMRSLTRLAQDDRDQPIVFAASKTLSGETTTLEPMRAQPAETEQITPNQWIEVGALVIAITLMMTFWMREVRRAPIPLPEGLNPAPLLSRTMAGVIDLLPALAIIALVMQLNPKMTVDPWAVDGVGSSLEQMTRWLMLIALFVLYTWISELISQTTMGKRLFGLKVVRLDGSRPGFGALTIRNMLRALDLMVPVLLLLPLLWPKRQRLGDLVAQTLVVEKSDKVSKEQTHDEA